MFSRPSIHCLDARPLAWETPINFNDIIRGSNTERQTSAGVCPDRETSIGKCLSTGRSRGRDGSAHTRLNHWITAIQIHPLIISIPGTVSLKRNLNRGTKTMQGRLLTSLNWSSKHVDMVWKVVLNLKIQNKQSPDKNSSASPKICAKMMSKGQKNWPQAKGLHLITWYHLTFNWHFYCLSLLCWH